MVARGLLPALRRLALPLDERMARSDTRGAARQALSGWIIGLRWLALLAISLTVAVATDFDERLAPAAVPRLWGGVALLLLSTTAWTVAGPRRTSTYAALTAQIATDVAILGWLLHAAGGVANPFAGVLAFHGILAAITLPRHGRVAAGGVAAFILALTAVEASGLAPPLPLGALGTDPVTLVEGGAAVTVLVAGGALLAGALAASLHRERDRLDGASLRLELERETVKSVVDCMADAVVFADPQGNIALRNHAAAQLWAGGPPAGSLRVCHGGETWKRLLAKLADPAAQEPHPTLVVGGRSFEASYARVRDRRGELAGVVMVARDITERLAAQAWRMREERLAVVGKLAAGLAHEINNPLGAVALFTRYVQRALPANHPMGEHLETVLRNAEACKRVVKDLLTYARQRPPDRRPIVAREILDDVARTLHVAARRAGVSVEIDAGETMARADPDHLRQILVNLGLNAIDAMAGGGVLRLAAAPAPGGVWLSVADTGPGIAPEHRERIFTAFYTTKPDGTGLGLAVVRDLIEAHRGTVEVHTEPGHGARFTIFLPDEVPA